MLTTVDPEHLPDLLRKALGPRWDFTQRADHLRIRHQDRAKTPYHPHRNLTPWPDLLERMETAFADQGTARGRCLPLRWGRETDLTISAIQALDPVLKDGRATPYSQGFIPQPVVRLTARRQPDGTLADGFLTSFINASRVELIPDPAAYAEAFDQLLTVLSRLGLHARHIAFHGRLAIWHRRQVQGITFRFDHADLPLGDLVLLWNATHPDRLVLDLGTSLERLAWAQTLTPWPDLIFRPLAQAAPYDALDAIRTATLLLANGITPTARGAGSTTRRVLQRIPAEPAALGLSRAVRRFHGYWQTVSPLGSGWPEVAVQVEDLLARSGAPEPTSKARPPNAAHACSLLTLISARIPEGGIDRS